MVDLSNFGNNFLQTNKFGPQAKKNIKKQGFAGVNDFLTQAGVDRNNLSAYNPAQLQSTLKAGPKPAAPASPTAYQPPGTSGGANIAPPAPPAPAPAPTIPTINEGFGTRFTNTGKFDDSSRELIKGAGFENVQAFLDQYGIDRNAKNIDPTTIRNALIDAYSKLGQPTPPANNVDPVQIQPPSETAQQGQSIGSSLLEQAVNLTNAGADALNIGNPAADPLMQASNNYTIGAQQDLGKVDQTAAAARAQGMNILNALQAQQQASDQDIQNYFNAQPLDTLRSRLANLNSAAQASGRTNARSTNEMSAELQRALIRDQATARLGANNQFRAQGIKELGDQRSTDQNLAALFSGQAANQGQLANTGLSNAGQLINSSRITGANIFNQGLQNQQNILALLNNLALQEFNAKNQQNQQNLANITGKKSSDQAKSLMHEQLQAHQEQNGGFLGLF